MDLIGVCVEGRSFGMGFAELAEPLGHHAGLVAAWTERFAINPGKALSQILWKGSTFLLGKLRIKHSQAAVCCTTDALHLGFMQGGNKGSVPYMENSGYQP
jgi:hypothetical protein